MPSVICVWLPIHGSRHEKIWKCYIGDLSVSDEERRQRLERSIMGLGEYSGRKNYYAQLQNRIRQLEISEEKYRSILEAAGEAIFIFDANKGVVLEVNPAACQLFGYDREALLEKNGDDLSCGEAPYDQAHAMAILATCRSSGRPQRYEWLAKHADSHVFWIHCSLSYFTLGDDERLVLMMRDIDEQKRSRERERLLAEQLRQSQKMDALGKLAGGVAHDYNNSLSAIIGSVDLGRLQLQADPQLADATRQSLSRCLDTIANVAESAAAFTRKLLDFSRQDPSAFSPINPFDILASARQLIASLFPREITVVWDYVPQSISVVADGPSLQNVILNVAINARDAMLEGELVEKYLYINSWLGEDGNWYVRLRDTGPGIAPQHLSDIFDPFFTTKPIGKGTGLGLSTAFSAINQWGGSIEVSSQLGEGAAFTLHLPIVSS
ncbi:MAG: PAS domain S-box protein [Planctomycetota bacterium]|nr:MAG: PAS domain S-box protein [Planctomycetota bacterium]